MLRYALKLRCQTVRRYQFQFSSIPPPSLFETRKVELIDYMRKELNDAHKSPYFVRKYLFKVKENELDRSYNLTRSLEGENVHDEGVPRKEQNRLLAAFQIDDDLEGTNDANADNVQYLQSLPSLSQGSSLMDLLKDETFGKDEVKEETASLDDTSSKNQDQYDTKSLMDLLEEDFSIKDEYDDENDQALKGDDDAPPKKSLLDLLDEDFFASDDDSQQSSTQNQRSESKSDHHRHSLMDLMEDNVNGDMYDEENKDSQSLMDLLNDDMSHARREGNKGNNSLMDLLDDDDTYTQQSFEDGMKISSRRESSLMDLLEEDAGSLQEDKNVFNLLNTTDPSVLDFNKKISSQMSTGTSYETSAMAMDSMEDNRTMDEKLELGMSASEWIEELLTGASMDKWTLSTRDYNTLLLYIVTFTSDFDEKIKTLIRVYSQMLELQNSGMKSVSPDCNTYSILLTSLHQSNRSRGTSVEICNHALHRLMPEDAENGTESETSRIELDHDLLSACMKTLGRRRKLEDAERLLDMALKSDSINVRPNVFRMMLDLYKTVDSQEKAIDIVRKCLYDENLKSTNLDALNYFLMSAISWPLKNRQGKRVSTFSYYSELVDILTDRQTSGHFFRPQIWNKLLNTTFRLSNSETDSYWHLAEKCINSLLEHRQVQVNPRYLELGLEISLKVKNPNIICRLIDKVEIDPMTDNTEPFKTHQVKSEFLKVPISTYMKAIKLCIETNKPSFADQILSHAIRSKIPSAILSNLYTLVMTGYVQNGDNEKAEHMFHQMDLVGLTKSETAYAAYIHALNLNNKYDEALNLLRNMVDQENDNGMKAGIGCFNACILNALKNGKYEDAIEIDKMMEKARISHNGTTFQGLIIAKAKLGDKESLRKTVEDAIKRETPMDYDTFASCLKFLLPQLCDNQTLDISKMRTTLRQMVENDDRVSSEAMELNRSLMNCLREDSRVPSKIKNKQQIFKLRNELWRIALQNALTLSAKI